ncbi:hypothetical protein Ahy_A06g028333 [Arachis hypogaea]|uniref:Uncharacterized protein n=1 Tax=Arachis hypogaea TaxID=3818 RepID=A0A445CQS9_ARAHY|nr:hypothetical protein Ahy_A06g028333 [Arachis hypogaea]
MRELTISDDEIKQLCLMDMDKILYSYGKTLKDYPPMTLETKADSSLLTKRAFDELVHFSYPNILENMSSKNFFKARTILAPALDIVEEPFGTCDCGGGWTEGASEARGRD